MGTQMPISDIATVQISLSDTGVSQAGFGVGMILGSNGVFGADRIRAYSNLKDVLVDFTSSNPEYLMAARYFGQAPHPTSLKIGKEAARVAQQVTIVFSADIIAANSIACKVGGVSMTATPFNASNAQTLTDLAAKIQATASVATAVSDGVHTITCTAAKAGVPFIISDVVVTGGVTQATAVIATSVANHGVAEDLAEIQNVDDSWYGFLWTEQDADQVLTAAAYIEAQRKIYLTVSSDANILSAISTTDIAYLLSAKKYARTALIFNTTATNYADAAWMGKCFVFDPGSETWAFKQLSGITADQLTKTKYNAAKAKHCNLYITRGGVDNTDDGAMTSGRFIDLTRGVDWLQARIEERIYSLIVNIPGKIPFTEAGVALIEKEIRAVLQNGISVGLVSPDPLPDNVPPDQDAYKVTFPKVATISTTNKANRTLPDGQFRAVVGGAIHKVLVNGMLTV